MQTITLNKPNTTYPEADDRQISAFRDQGFLVVHDAVPAAVIAQLNEGAWHLVEHRDELAKDWDWRRGETLDKRQFRIVQCGFGRHHSWIESSPLRQWMTTFAAQLMGRDMRYWYDQFLGKPPVNSSPTPWHQDEAYWGRDLADRGITCWLPMHDVDVTNGCMHFVPGVHRHVIRRHQNPVDRASDLLTCELEPGDEVIPCPLKVGSVTFHHSGTPHMTPANISGSWRLTLASHFAENGYCRESDPYDWRIHVDQHSGKRIRAVDGREM